MEIKNKELKIGKGSQRPKLTLSGTPCPNPIPVQIGIGNGHYVVLNPTDRTDYRDVIKALREEYKTPKRTVKKKDS